MSVNAAENGIKKLQRKKSPDEHKVQLMMSRDLLEQIDGWRHDNRFPTRAAAIRALLISGLSAELKSENQEEGEAPQ